MVYHDGSRRVDHERTYAGSNLPPSAQTPTGCCRGAALCIRCGDIALIPTLGFLHGNAIFVVQWSGAAVHQTCGPQCKPHQEHTSRNQMTFCKQCHVNCKVNYKLRPHYNQYLSDAVERAVGYQLWRLRFMVCQGPSSEYSFWNPISFLERCDMNCKANYNP